MSEALKDLTTYAEASVALAQKAGAPEALATVSRRREVTVQWRDGTLEKSTEATIHQLTLRLYVEGRYMRVVTGDLRPAALRQLVADAMGTAKLLQPDGYGSLLAPAYYHSAAPAQLALADPRYAALSVALRRERLGHEEAAARTAAQSAALVSVAVGCTDSVTDQSFATSNGCAGEQRATLFTLNAEVTTRDGPARTAEGDGLASTRFWRDLPPTGTLGRLTTQRALARRGAAKGPSTPGVVVIRNDAVDDLLAHVLRPLLAMQLQLGKSFYRNKLHQRIASRLLSVTDDPWIPRGLGSTRFDDFGMATKPMAVVREGVLQNFYIDGYFGHKLGLAPTSSAPTNLRWGLGDKGGAELIAGVDHGLLVTGFLGGNSNDSTGDFSLGVEGFVIRKGAIAEPVREMNLAANHLTFWQRLVAIGNDPFPYSAWGAPTLVFDAVQV